MALSTRDRRALVVLGAILAAALVAYFLLLRPGGEEAAQTPTPGPTDTTSPRPTPTGTGTPRTSPPTSGIPVAANDPFSPLVTPTGENGGDGGPTPTGTETGTGSPTPTGTETGTTSPTPTGTGGTTSPTPTDTGTTTPVPTTTGPTPTGSPPTSESPSNDGTDVQIDGHTVTLINVFTRDGQDMAQVAVDGEGFTVAEGETFAGVFTLVSVGDTCATFLFEDEQFVLCESPEK